MKKKRIRPLHYTILNLINFSLQNFFSKILRFIITFNYYRLGSQFFISYFVNLIKWNISTFLQRNDFSRVVKYLSFKNADCDLHMTLLQVLVTIS